MCGASRGGVGRSRLRPRPPRLLSFYAFVEAGIGLYALLFPTLFGVFQRISLFVPHGHAGLGFTFDVGLSALLIGPPTVLMGGTIPILTQALARSAVDATRFHALVYALNTAGAFVGALALLPDLPPEEGPKLDIATRKRDIDGIYLFAPTSTEERIRLVAERGGGGLSLA